MSHLVRFRTLVVTGLLLTATAACSKESETKKQADRAAERVNDKVADLKNPDDRDNHERVADNGTADIVDRQAVGDRRELGNSAPATGTVINTGEIAAQAKDADELRAASEEFQHRRMIRVATLRAVHAIDASQPMMINSLTQAFPLVENDRAEVNEKLQIFQMRLDEAGNAIQSLELVEPADWEPRSDAATKALERVEDARTDAWDALHGADRITGRTSMR